MPKPDDPAGGLTDKIIFSFPTEAKRKAYRSRADKQSRATEDNTQAISRATKPKQSETENKTRSRAETSRRREKKPKQKIFEDVQKMPLVILAVRGFF